VSAHTFCIASLSDVGRVRNRNEDACREFENAAGRRLLVLADGMGGHRAGATASRVTVETIGEIFHHPDSASEDPDSLLRRAVETANTRVHEMAKQDAELRGMGTTAVALLLAPDGRGWVAHVGDSRAYRYRDNQLGALTSDHSVVAELERRGLISAEQAAVHPRRNEILRCVGIDAQVEVDAAAVDLLPGDRFLLCSDGLSCMLDETEIAVILDDHPPAKAARLLVERANEHGGHDNVTVQVVEVGAGGAGLEMEEGVETVEIVDGVQKTPAAGRSGDARPPADLEGSRPRRVLWLAASVAAAVIALALLWWRG
jgi:protein phosphatase